MNKELARQIAEAVEKTLNELCTEVNGQKVQFQYKGGSFDAAGFDLKLRVNVENAQGEVKSKEALDYEQVGRMYGLPDLGTKFTTWDGAFETYGFATRSHKYPVLAKSLQNGKIYKFTVDTVLDAVKRAA